MAPDRTPDELRDEEELLAEIFREFAEGLPERLETLRSALEKLGDGHDSDAADLFYRTAHSLKGTAPSFDAHELVEHAAALSEVGLRWYEGAAPRPAEVVAAREALERLGAAVERYAARQEGRASG